MNTNLIKKWLRDPQFAPDRKIIEADVAETPRFLPIETVDRPQQLTPRLGYARVSTEEQHFDAKTSALEATGAERIFAEKISGTQKNPPRA